MGLQRLAPNYYTYSTVKWNPRAVAPDFNDKLIFTDLLDCHDPDYSDRRTPQQNRDDIRSGQTYVP